MTAAGLPATRAFPDADLCVTCPNERTVAFFATTGCRAYAEVGVYKGDTALRIAQIIDGEGEIHLFGDYSWTLRDSPSMNPVAFPDVERLYSEDPIDARQVALVVDLLVRPDDRYEELVPNKVFRKREAA